MATSTHRIRIHAKPEAVYQAIATEEGMKGWYTTSLEGSFSEDGVSTYHFPKDEVFEWKSTKLVPGQTVERECVSGPGVAKGTQVIWTLESQGADETIVHLEHTGWPDEHDALATCNTLWGILLGRLREYTETGRLVPAYS